MTVLVGFESTSSSIVTEKKTAVQLQSLKKSPNIPSGFEKRGKPLSANTNTP